MKKFIDVAGDEVAKNPKFNALKTKVNNLENEIPDATTSIHINQYNADKMEMLIKNTRYKLFSDYNCFEYKN